MNRFTSLPGLVALACVPTAAMAQETAIGERPVVEAHVSQQEIEAGQWNLRQLFEAGQFLFDARFNMLDGQGRPASTGTGAPREPVQPAFIRTSAPDANSCAGCHNQPVSGGAGDIVANVFVLAQALDPVTFSVDGAFSNERNTLGMHGAGVIEMLAREMSGELIAIREDAAAEAVDTGDPVTRDLEAKGISFGQITVLPDGRVDPTAIEGVDWDLIVKPFHQKGAVVSLREFTNNAMNHHHGMQSVERFGAGTDPDADGVIDELSVGDITATTLFQAALPAPRQVYSGNAERRKAARHGERVFAEIGCGGCHQPTLVLGARNFSEPNPFNPPGNLRPADVTAPFAFNLVVASKSNLVLPMSGGRVLVRAFTDLKRHDVTDAEYNHFANEQVAQGSLVGFADPADFTVPPQPRPTTQFLTRKLWDAGNTDPYGHRGDLTTLTEAIHFHGGDAKAERDAYFALDADDQAAVIEFLKTLVVVP